ncbi:MAG: hypothetical protein HC820_06745 [Hydrococcus sp. RM1_1_31]|nr:hypothetical protein [Hydrococcus sp. RM1_1_31]
MLRRLILIATVIVFLIFQVRVSQASALELNQDVHAEILNEAGKTVVLSSQKITKGQQLFNSTCLRCHSQSQMEKNNNMTLGLKTFSVAEPDLDNLLTLVDYLKRP